MLSKVIGLHIVLFAASCAGQKYQNSSLSTTSSNFAATSLDTPITTSALGTSTGNDLGALILHGLEHSLGATTNASSVGTIRTITRTSSVVHTVRLANLTSNATQTIAGNGSWEQAQACNSASVSWREANTGSWSWYPNPIMTTIINESTILPNATTTTLCDGYPRVDANVTSYTNTFILTASASTRTYVPPPCSTGCVSCDIPSEACTKLWSSYNVCTHRSECPYSPACDRPTNTKCTATRRPACTFTAGPVRLVYFPLESTTKNLCGNNTTLTRPANSTSPTTTTTPTTIEAYGTTFTSGTAYISFANLAAVDQCGTTTGTPLSNFFLPLPSSEVSSMCGGELNAFFQGPTSTQLNFADLIPPIATDIYKCQPQCMWGLPDSWKFYCPVIYDDYKPMLACPTQVAQLQPEWAECGFNPDTYKRYQKEEYYLFDPPIALSQAQEVIKPTAPAQTAHTTVDPVRQTRVPVGTAQPEPDDGPTTGEQPDDSGTQEPSGDGEPQSNGQDDAASHSSQIPQDQASPGDTEQPGQQDDSTPSEQESSNDIEPANTAETPDDSNADDSAPDLGVLNEALGQAIEAATATANPPASVQNDPGAVAFPDSSADAATVPAGLSVLNEASSQAQATGGQPAANGNVFVAPNQNEAEAAPNSIVTVIPAVPSVVAVSRSGSDFVVNGQSVAPGGLVTIGGELVSVNINGDGLVLGGSSTLALADGQATSLAVAPQDPATIIQTGSGFVIAGATLAQGQIATVNGQVVSILPAGTGVVVEGQTIPNGRAAVTSIPLAGVSISRAGSYYIVNGQTISAAGPTTINGMTATILPDGAGFALGTDTISLQVGSATTVSPARSGITGVEISRDGSALIIDGQTLSPGQVATIDGTTLSALSNGAGLVIGSTTISLAPGASATLASAGDAADLEIARSGSTVVIDGHTLTAGQTTTIDGQSVSVLEDGTGLVIGSRTISLDDHATTTIVVDSDATATSSTTADGAIITRLSVTSIAPAETAISSRSEAMRSNMCYGIAISTVVSSVILNSW